MHAPRTLGEWLPRANRTARRRVRAARSCELFPRRRLVADRAAGGRCLEAIEKGARLVIVNAGPTPYDRIADAVLRTPIGDILPRLVDRTLGTASEP
jgi:NAD-dependent deacetylase